MKLLVFASCCKTKALTDPRQPGCVDLKSQESKTVFLKKLQKKKRAREMYRGALNISLNAAIDKLRTAFTVSYYIVSAGFGILQETEEIPPYNCTFSTMNNAAILVRAEKLHIPTDFQKIITTEQPDVIYLALGKKYLTALGDWDKSLPCKTVAFAESANKKVITLPADNFAVKYVSSVSSLPIHGVIGYKGDLLLLATKYLLSQNDPQKELKNLLEEPDTFQYLLSSL